MVNLIDFNQCCWQNDRACHLFLHYEIEVILHIPLNPVWPSDKLIWRFITNEIYKVKSRYRTGINYLRFSRGTEDTSNHSPDTFVWNSIHKLQVQPKVRMFFWRAVWNILSIGMNLSRRGVARGIVCIQCSFHNEDDRYILFDCDFSKTIWNLLPLDDKWRRIPALSFKALLYSILLHFENKDIAVFTTYCWLLWYARNKRMFENKGR